MGLKKANAARFDRSVAEIIVEDMDAEIHQEKTRIFREPVYVIETKAGPMTVWPNTLPKKGKQQAVFTVYCKFEDVERANKLGLGMHLNPYSGKYNFHECGHDEHAASALQSFRQHLAACGTMPHDTKRDGAAP